MDETDKAIAKARQRSFKNPFVANANADVNLDDNDSQALQNLKILMEKREFATWFRFSNEVNRDLYSTASELHALVKPVLSAQEGSMAKLMMIRQAKYTVDATYYIFTLDEAGLALVNEMKAAVRRGVNVRILVDSLGSISASLKGNPHFRTLLEDAKYNAGFVLNPETGAKTNIRAKVEILTFNPVSNLPAWFRSRGVEILNVLGKKLAADPSKFEPLDTTHWNPNRRTHDKILITDAEFPELSIGIIGGRNISNHYYELDPTDFANFRDVEVLIRNDPAAARTMDRKKSVGEVLNQQFDRLYFHRANRRANIGILGYFFNQKNQTAKLDAATARVEKVTQTTMKDLGEDFNSPQFGKNYLNSGFFDQNVSFVNSTENLLRTLDKLKSSVKDSVKPADYEKIVRDASSLTNTQSLLSKIVVLAAGEKEAITVVSPYLWLSPKDIHFIYAWLEKDPRRTFTVITNSIVTSDNMPAQILVDIETIPNLMENPRFHSQIKVYEYGRADDVDLGGTQHYGKLHFKGAYFKSLQTSLVATYNKDPRSQVLNSESGVVIEGAEYSKNMEREIDSLVGKSHQWNTDEFRQIRSNPKLPKMKQEVITHETRLYNVMKKLKLWWLI
jgi:putative cardiolipin synthase